MNNMSTDEIIIKEYDETERDACIDLLKKTFPSTSNEYTFEWRFESSGRERPILICGKNSEKVVSFNSWIPWKFTYHDKKYLGYQSGESATDVRYRGKGLFSKVLCYADEIARERGIDFLFGFPSSMSYGAFFKSGYNPIATYYYYLKLLNPLKKDIGESKYKKYSQFPLDIVIEKEKITPVVNDDYCVWRYNNNPKKYDIVEYIECNNRARFYLRENKWKGLPEVLLLDCQFTCNNEMFYEHAFNYIDSLFAGKALYIRSFFNPNTDRGRELNKYFRMRVSSKYCIFIIKDISNRIDLNILYNSNAWNIMPHLVDEL
jgi:hypothetical protein